MFSVVHLVNQFFAGIGGEEKADSGVVALEQLSGPSRGLKTELGVEASVCATIYFGDNYFHEHTEDAHEAVLREVAARKPAVVIAGPAFNSGRYGVACVEICHRVSSELNIPCVTAMQEENPGVSVYQEHRNPKVFLLPTTETAAGMGAALKELAQFTLKLAKGIEHLGTPLEEGYLPRGVRRQRKTEKPGVDRAIEMLLAKVSGKAFSTEVPMQTWDRVKPAGPVEDLSRATVALVTTSGVVPWGNPDGFKTFRNTFWRKYGIGELRSMEPGVWEAVHGGYNVATMNKNPLYGVPLDALRDLEAAGVFGRLYPAYYVIPGNQGAPSVMKRVGQEIAADLKENGVAAALLVST